MSGSATMRGLWLEGGEARLRDDVPLPRPPEGEALVRVLRAGICNTDLELVRGYYPFTGVLGHEFVGVVEEVDGDSGAAARGPRPELVGRRVVGEINAACGSCRECRAARPTHCADRTVLGIVGRDGAFAEYLLLPVENLHPVPDALSDDAAVFTEPLAAALEIREQVQVRPGDRVLLVGDGKLGQLVARVLALAGCELVAVGRHPRKLALMEATGARTVRAPDAASGESIRGDRSARHAGGSDGVGGDPPQARELPPGIEPRSFDVAVECTGNPSGFALARAALRPRGTLVLKSTYAGALTLDASSVVVDELTLVGSRCGPFLPALRLLEAGLVDPTPLIDARYPLTEAEAALAHAARRGILKVLLEME